ncbi:hypothetical protein GOODEAATRI_003932 [Goodea atripinnis]|uniref:Uncharacterized protein n=1 Tax=Goodea atripinnis TaxID=208336 RepID=A0ABV0PKN9_9TELE
MGSLIIREVIKDLIPKGIKQAKVVMLAGTRSWLFDEEQLRVENIYMGGQSLSEEQAVFAASCLSHTVITKRTPAKGCPFHLVDTCQWPQCNPTCPALVDQATQQQLTLLQMLVAMGLDPQKLGLDPEGEADSLASMVRNGG